MYKVYGKVFSRASRVLWMFEEIGEPYEFIDTGPQSEPVLALNPSGKVPVLKVDDAVLTDSTAILTYLADKHGKLTHPAGTLARARQDGLTQCILDEIDAVLWTNARHSFILPEEHRVPAIRDSLSWEFDRNLTRLANRLQGPFLMGSEMTVPDIILAHCLGWAFSAKFPVASDAMRAYGKMMRSREAFVRVLALNES